MHSAKPGVSIHYARCYFVQCLRLWPGLGPLANYVPANQTLISPIYLAVDAAGGVYFAEQADIRKVTAGGVVVPLAGFIGNTSTNYCCGGATAASRSWREFRPARQFPAGWDSTRAGISGFPIPVRPSGAFRRQESSIRSRRSVDISLSIRTAIHMSLPKPLKRSLLPEP